MGERIKDALLINPSVIGNIKLDGVDVTATLKDLLASDPTKVVPAVDDSKTKLLQAELEGVKKMLKILQDELKELKQKQALSEQKSAKMNPVDKRPKHSPEIPQADIPQPDRVPKEDLIRRMT